MRVLNAVSAAILLAVASTGAFAGSEFVTIQRGEADLNDATPSRVVSFNLPATVNRSSTIANSAVLDLAVLGSEYDFNEVYINPPTTTCTDNSEDANQAASLGALQEHDDSNLKDEWATNHIAFSGSLLRPGPNQILFCARTAAGDVNGANIDNIGIKSVVLHYHTTN